MSRSFVIHSMILTMAAPLAAILLWQLSLTKTPREIQASYHSRDRAILDRHGAMLDEIRVETAARRLEWTSLATVPYYVTEMFGTEATALKLNDLMASSNYVRGPMPSAQRIAAAIALRMKWSRAEILEAYLNLAFYRPDLQGLAAASYGLLDKSPATLRRTEAALLAALASAPGFPVARAQPRACEFLATIGSEGQCALLSADHLASIERSYAIRPFTKIAPFVSERLSGMASARSGAVVRSTIDREAQWQALNTLHRSDQAGAVVILENATGNVIAYVGNSVGRGGDLALKPFYAGQSLLPFIYAKALDERIVTPASLFASSMGRAAVVSPRDRLSLRTALRSGSEIPALQTYELVGVENLVQSLAQFGLSVPGRSENYGPSLARGQLDVRLFEMANAYRVIANKGIWTPVRFALEQVSEVPARRVLQAGTAFLVADMLTTKSEPWLAEQNAGAATFAISEKFTVAVWQEKFSLTTARALMAHLHRESQSQPPRPPRDVRQANGEWFLEGTPVANVVVPKLFPTRIAYPLRDSVIELRDEDARQKLFIQIASPQPDHNLYLNKRRLGQAKPMLPWNAESGRYILELRDSRGQVIDKIRFAVRGRRFAQSH